MENEIKVGEFIRTKLGDIKKITEGFEFIIKRYNESDNKIVKHSSNLIDLIQCGDYVNGYIVRRTYLDGAIHYIKLGEQITGNRTYNDDIKTIVTKEMMESISYKVTKM